MADAEQAKEVIEQAKEQAKEILEKANATAKEIVEKAKATAEKAKATVEKVVDIAKGLVEVELVKDLKQEREGAHTIFTSSGPIEFTDGVAKTTKEQADYLKQTGHIK